MDRAAFEADSRTRDAVERCLERLSEAAAKLGEQADEMAPGLPWPAVRAFGNVLRHAYDQVDPARIWEIVTRDLPRMAADSRCIFWMTMINRAEPEAPQASVLTEIEIRLLDSAVRSPPGKATMLSNYLTKLARLGGYLARAGDPPPGNTVIWRGLSRLCDIKIGAKIMSGCG